jgi:uncharacterized membrane protein YhhN
MPFFLKSSPFNIVYCIIFTLNILFLFYYKEYFMVSKPMIMASLLAFYISTEKRQSNSFILAMIFAMLGDIFLNIHGEAFFLIGLFCFLIMQILYAFNFYFDIATNTNKIIITSICLIFFSIGVLSLFWKELGTMLFPVIIYAFSISTMAILAILRNPILKSYKALLVGVIFFIFSDAIIGYTMFVSPFKYSQVLVISTYMIAQYLIVTSQVAAHIKK